ncbi:ATP-grasp domain-containing protein [Seonamhaeicola sp. ML3]|uniref:ATP-grasp domain-containing protein n=1 Tax=Seonamhaeicola sp. ML3 TaxID=2937786 RepID=UPI002010717D|nr:ATP-grasp domain-containing protein [Seonamhaeicola sp. ML3]
MKKDKISVLIPDGESHILIHVINCLSQIELVDVFVMSSTKHNPMRYSRYIKGFSYYPENKIDEIWIENVNREINKHQIDVVLPIFEIKIKTLIKHRKSILNQDKLGLLPSIVNFNTAINKGALAKHLEKYDIPGPKSITISPGENTNKLDVLNFPVIIKPLEGFGGGQGIKVFKREEDIKAHFAKNNFKYTNIIQEYIEGYDIDCSVLCNNGEILAYTIQKGSMLGKNKFTPQYGLQFIEEPDVYKIVEKLTKSLDWNGVAHIDMRYNKNTCTFNIIEVNTRFWVSLDASLLAGVNFPYLYCLSSTGLTFNKPQFKFIEYLNLKGLIRKVKYKPGFIFKIGFILNNTPLKFALIDPVPMIYKFITRTKNIIVARF